MLSQQRPGSSSIPNIIFQDLIHYYAPFDTKYEIHRLILYQTILAYQTGFINHYTF